MYLFSVKKEKKHLTTFLPLLLLVTALGFFVLFSNSFSTANLSYERDLLEQALEKSIAQCYALEGSYPVSLEYLIAHYGLIYNEEHFYIDYRYIGGNLWPDITIIERD